MKIAIVAGARPNFMKIAPIIRALVARGAPFSFELIHTGQHYDAAMSDVFFEELGIPQPDVHLGVGSGSHAAQTAAVMTGFEGYALEHEPDLVMVVGDVNSTLACSIVAKKLNIAVAHVEAGLRSGDRAMPEEINRLVTDAISDLFFVTEPSGREHLLREGQPESAVHFVGHVMIDNLFHEVEKLGSLGEPEAIAALKATRPRYGVVTLHRPSNVDDEAALRGIMGALNDIAAELPLLFPVHPRTRGRIDAFGIDLAPGIELIEPQSYRSFLSLWKDAALVLTDSGGLQEETTALGVPCLTLRENTERPVTLSHGSNRLVGKDPDAIRRAAADVLASARESYPRPELWDGHAAERIVAVLEQWDRQ